MAHTIARDRYSAELLTRVARGWKRLAEDERRGVMRAARLAAELAALGAPAGLLAQAARVVQDEVRHVDVCAQVLDALEAPAAVRRAPHLEVAVGVRPSMSGSEAGLVRTLMAELAVPKPLRASALAAARALVREPLLAWAYTELLRDEARHTSFGAEAADWVLRHLPPLKRQALWADCMVAAARNDVGDPEAEELGLVPALVH